MNDVPSRAYVLRKGETTRTEKRWSPFMRQQCEKWGMKPICDHEEYCKDDPRSLYLGQSGHLGYPEDRTDEKYHFFSKSSSSSFTLEYLRRY